MVRVCERLRACRTRAGRRRVRHPEGAVVGARHNQVVDLLAPRDDVDVSAVLLVNCDRRRACGRVASASLACRGRGWGGRGSQRRRAATVAGCGGRRNLAVGGRKCLPTPTPNCLGSVSEVSRKCLGAPLRRTSHTRTLESTPHDMKTPASTGDHCTSSTDPT